MTHKGTFISRVPALDLLSSTFSFPVFPQSAFCFRPLLSRSIYHAGICEMPIADMANRRLHRLFHARVSIPPTRPQQARLRSNLYCSYLQTILPLLVVALSIVHLLWTSTRLSANHPKYSGYERLTTGTGPHSSAQTDLPPDSLLDGFSDDMGDETDSVEGGENGRLMLIKSTSRGSIVEADTPLGRRTSEAVKVIAVVALIATNAALLSIETDDDNGRITAVAGLFSWIYVLILCSLRLFLAQSRRTTCWNHTAAIYTANWFLSLIIFRSEIIHPMADFAKKMAVLQFIMVTLLFGIALTTRKGNKTVLMEWEDGIQPSREPLARFSLSLHSAGWMKSSGKAGSSHYLSKTSGT